MNSTAFTAPSVSPMALQTLSNKKPKYKL